MPQTVGAVTSGPSHSVPVTSHTADYPAGLPRPRLWKHPLFKCGHAILVEDVVPGSKVEIFAEKDATWRRPLGADGHFFRRQLEGFAASVLDGAPMRGAGIEDGLASVRAMAAIAESARSGQAVLVADTQGAI